MYVAVLLSDTKHAKECCTNYDSVKHPSFVMVVSCAVIHVCQSEYIMSGSNEIFLAMEIDRRSRQAHVGAY